MEIAISSIGVKTGYAIELTKGTMPKTGFKRIMGIKSIPEIDSAPETAETTTLDNTEYKTYISMLKDLGGALALTVSFSNDFFTKWEAMCTEYETGKVDGKSLWIVFDIPDFEKAIYIPVQPSRLGMPAIETNSIIEKTAYITPTGEPVFETKPTYVAETI